jgi:hypothetical protein
MKSLGLYTVRGSVNDNSVKKIQLFDGRFDTAYRIKDFKISSDTPSSSSSDAYATLATQFASAIATWHWDDVRQVAWTGAHVTTFGGAYAQDSVIDPDNLIVEDLFIYGNCGSGANKVNYMITMEKFDVSEATGALAMVKNKAQGSGN